MRKFIRVLAFLVIVLGLVAYFTISHPFTRWYVCVQICVGLFVFGALWLKKGRYTYTNTAASILTIIGVFGTFLGIFIGLQAFDDANIEKSIPPLLEGLKLAFLTSLVGILSAIILKGYAFAYQLIKGKNPSEEAITQLFRSQTADLLLSLTELLRAQTTDSAQVRETLGSIKTALTDNEQSTVFTQLCNLTATVSNKHGELVRAQADEGRKTRDRLTSIEISSTQNQKAISAQLQALTETVSKNVGEIAAKVGQIATGQLIEALREVIKDFNQNLNEQFGENFKQLNEAVKKTVDWQKQYSQQMDELAAEFQIAANSIEKSRESLEKISESSNTIADRSQSIAACAEKMEHILHTLNDQLEAFSELRQKAFPVIEKNLDDLTKGFSARVDTAINDSHGSMERQRRALVSQSLQLQNIVGSTTIKLTELTESFGAIVERNGEDMKNHVNRLNQDLHKELERSLSTLAGYFESLSEGFVKNYAELTRHYTQAIAELQKSVDASRRLR